MRRPGIRGQLTVWYSLILAASLAAFGCLSYWAMRYGIHDTLRSELEERAEGVQDILNDDAPQGRPALADELKEFADGLGSGGRIRVADETGVVFASTGMELPVEHADSARARRPWKQSIDGTPFLIQRLQMRAAGSVYDVSIAVATLDFDRALGRGTLLLFFAAPLFLLLAAGGGYWMSLRALRPVDHMTQAARNISAENLSKRLDVPPTRDELARLAATLNQMLERLQTAFERIAEFTADASHELRSPVAVIRTSAEIALRKPRNQAGYRESLSQILREADRVSELIEGLLVLARADSGAALLQSDRIELNAVIDEACTKMRLLSDEKGVSLAFDPSGPVWIRADPLSIERLVLILLDNAVKYTPAGGRVEARTSTENGFAIARICDSGIGIGEEDMPHIFERFFRADRARSRGTYGAGLGLAIGKWIAESHGGEIRATSELGRGSSFEVRLPLFRVQ